MQSMCVRRAACSCCISEQEARQPKMALEEPSEPGKDEEDPGVRGRVPGKGT